MEMMIVQTPLHLSVFQMSVKMKSRALPKVIANLLLLTTFVLKRHKNAQKLSSSGHTSQKRIAKY